MENNRHILEIPLSPFWLVNLLWLLLHAEDLPDLLNYQRVSWWLVDSSLDCYGKKTKRTVAIAHPNHRFGRLSMSLRATQKLCWWELFKVSLKQPCISLSYSGHLPLAKRWARPLVVEVPLPMVPCFPALWHRVSWDQLCLDNWPKMV